MSEALIITQNISFQWDNAHVPLFQNLSFVILPGIHVLTGRNGVGKTILAEILAKKKMPTSGKIIHNTNVAYLPQNPVSTKNSVFDYLSLEVLFHAQDSIKKKENNYIFLMEKMGSSFWLSQEKIKEKLIKEGLPDNILSKKMAELSGGKYKKIQLIKLREQKRNFIILDEPSNHLDNKSIDWLIQWIYNNPLTTFFIVTHDERLLNISHSIYELNQMGIEYTEGSWKDHQLSRQQRTDSVESIIVQQQRKLSQLNQTYQHKKEQSLTSQKKGKKKQKQ